MKKCLLSVLIVLLLNVGSFAQTSYEFWFAAPDILDSQDDPIALIISTYSNAAQVTISIPANPSFTPLVYNIPANATQSITLTSYQAMIETNDGDVIQNKGIYISSTQPVTAYYEVQYIVNRDMFTLKGPNALGFNFYVPFQRFGDNGMGNSYSGFEIVATMDNTIVNITPTEAVWFSTGVTSPAGTTFSRTLNMGQTYAVRANGYYSYNRPAGTHVTSNHPIAITMKDDCMHAAVWGTCSELIGDQILPVEKSGNVYIVPLGLLYASQGERAIITAVYDSTKIYLDGSTTPVATINQGQQYVVTMPYTPLSNSTRIQAFNPISVMHISGNGCEYGAAMIPPVDGSLFTSSQVAFARSCPSNEVFSIMLITQSGNENSFSVNGNPSIIAGASFSAVPGTAGAWLEARINLSSNIATGQACRISNSSGNFHCGVLCGGNTSGCSYGYFTDFFNTITNLPDDKEKAGFLIIPNPSNGTFSVLMNFESEGNNQVKCRVHNINGALVKDFSLIFTGSRAEVDISELTPGMYVISVENRDGNVFRQKLLKY